MAQAPYIPAPDAAFDNWSANFSTLITAAPATYGLVSGDATAIAAVVDPWHTSYLAAINPSTRTPVTVAAKDAARAAAEAVIRPYAIQISRNAAVSNDDKTAVGVNLPNTARTPVPPPTTQPVISLVSSTHNLMMIAYRDTATPTSKAKPPGAIGLDLRLWIGTGVPPTPDSVSPYGTLTKSPAAIGFSNGDIGKTAVFWGRWSTRSGPGGQAQFGPWSAPLSASIT